ncbi:MAG: CPBP family intramembrane glutamic endopeptidase, partial [Chloroflexota bacterium]
LVFSIFHLSQGSPGVLVPIFITGLLLAWLYYRTGSLWASIVAHGSQNAVALASTLYQVWTTGQT